MAAHGSVPTTAPTAGPTAGSRPNRRRQRSVRVTVAVGLLALATVLELLALPTQSPVWLSISSVVALLCGWAAARIVYSELVQSRREAAADRAAQAEAYRSVFAARIAEHLEFTTTMTGRLTRRDREVAELSRSTVDAQRRAGEAERRAAEAETRVQREARRVVESQDQVQRLSARIAELEAALVQQVDGRVDELAGWHGDAPVSPAHA